MSDEAAPAVAEVQGLYGPFSFAEKAFQKIWLRGDFDRSAARLSDGRTLRVLHPGKWNLLGGPDFKDARLRFGDGREITGDVELHLRASDWLAHRHVEDPAYNRVVLHVVLFPPEPGHVTRGMENEIPLLVLLPLLPHDLEEFAADESVEALAGKSFAGPPEELAALTHSKLVMQLRSHAAERWRRKVHFARVRLDRLGWEHACHGAALETLGYRFNRAPMLRVAERWPLSRWTADAFSLEEVFASEAARWSVQGVRPANHPRARLLQYKRWTTGTRDWPARWAEIAEELPQFPPDAGTREVRRGHGFRDWRQKINQRICADVLGGTRLDNLICDALLPLAAARARGSFDFGVWFNWFPGDQPPAIVRILQQLGVCDGREQPACHGFAQGLLGWLMMRDARR